MAWGTRICAEPFVWSHGSYHDPTFSARQYAAHCESQWILSVELCEVIPWRIANLNDSIPRRVCAVDSTPVVAYTDASGEGHIACIIYVDGVRTSSHTHVPSWLKTLLPGIFEYELLPDVFGLAMAAELAPWRPVLLRCDNQGAIGTVLRGSCRAKLGRTIVSIFRWMAAAFATTVWFGYVKSALNCSDGPSRCCSKLPTESHSKKTEANYGVPRLSEHIFSPKKEMYSAQYQCSFPHRGRTSPWPCQSEGSQNAGTNQVVGPQPSPQ